MKFDDWQESDNPLREREGHSDKHMAVIRKIIKAKRYPCPDMLIHCTPGYDIFVDSIITAGYDSDLICRDADVEPESGRVPCHSAESVEDIDFDSSSEEYDMVP